MISGPARAGVRLSASAGEWSGGGTTSFSFQRVRDGRDIPGARGAQYQVKPLDRGHTLSVRVTAVNEAGSAQASSAPVRVALR